MKKSFVILCIFFIGTQSCMNSAPKSCDLSPDQISLEWQSTDSKSIDINHLNPLQLKEWLLAQSKSNLHTLTFLPINPTQCSKETLYELYSLKQLQLTVCNLARCSLGNMDSLAIGSIFSGLSYTKVQELNLAENAMQSFSLVHVCTVFNGLNNLKNLHTLILSKNGLGGYDVTKLSVLAKSLKALPYLAKLDLSDNQFDNLDAEAFNELIKLLVDLRHLTFISLDHNFTDPKRQALIEKALSLTTPS